MKTGDRHYRENIRRADHVYADLIRGHHRIQIVNIGPFPTKRTAVAWLTSWLPEPRPLRCDGEPGSWHWFRREAAA